jgi:hypothetical protein
MRQSLRNWISFIGTQHNFHKTKRNNIFLIILSISMPKQKEKQANFKRNEHNSEKYNKSHISLLINRIIANSRLIPFWPCIHN